jgi:hypothetical protein
LTAKRLIVSTNSLCLNPSSLPYLHRNAFDLRWDGLSQRGSQPIHEHQNAGVAGTLSLRRTDNTAQRHQTPGVALEYLGDSRLLQGAILVAGSTTEREEHQQCEPSRLKLTA